MKPFQSLALLLAVPLCVLAADPADEPPPAAFKPKSPGAATAPKPGGAQE
ncbi:MAG: hypothetical protein HZA91_06020 [Verrucomicrobia bacterium]|nr:hypothetical protein [Verrucomicrobiota bacterium]